MVEINRRLADLYQRKTQLLQEEDAPGVSGGPIKQYAEMLQSIHNYYFASKTGDDEYSTVVEDVNLDGLCFVFHFPSLQSKLIYNFSFSCSIFFYLY